MVNKLDEKHLNIVNVIIGILVCIISILIMIFSTATILILLLLIANILLIIGIAFLLNALTNEKLQKSDIIFQFITAGLAILVGVLAVIFIISNPTESIQIIVIIFGISLLIIGIVRIFIGLLNKEFPDVYRGLIIIIGIITVILSILSMVSLSIGTNILVLYIAIPFLLNGIARIALGIIDIK